MPFEKGLKKKKTKSPKASRGMYAFCPAKETIEGALSCPGAGIRQGRGPHLSLGVESVSQLACLASAGLWTRFVLL